MREVIGARELRWLGASRIAFGLVFLLRTTPLLAPFEPTFMHGTNGWLGWPDDGWHVPMLGMSLSPVVLMLLVVVRTLAATGLMLGFCSRICGVIAGACGYVTLTHDAFGYFHHLHMLYVGAILFALVDADSALALRLRAPQAARSSLTLMRSFTASIYLWAAIGKLASEWGTGRGLAAFRDSGALERIAWLLTPERCAPIEMAVVIVELAIGLGLLWSRARVLALIAAFAMHATFEMVARVDSIGWQMFALLLVFIRSEQPREATQ